LEKNKRSQESGVRSQEKKRNKKKKVKLCRIGPRPYIGELNCLITRVENAGSGGSGEI
jgi:hypothetical protein